MFRKLHIYYLGHYLSFSNVDRARGVIVKVCKQVELFDKLRGSYLCLNDSFVSWDKVILLEQRMVEFCVCLKR